MTSDREKWMKTDFPLAIEIEINHDCNKTCAYCPNAKHERVEKGRMDQELFRNLMRQLQDIDFRGRVSFHFYNEPLLSPDLESYVQETKTYLPSCRIDIFTNGTLLDEVRLKSLIEAGVDKFTVTKHVNTDLSRFEEARERLSAEDAKKVRYVSYKSIPLTNRGGVVKGVGPKTGDQPLKLPCFVPECAVVVTVNGNVIPCYEDFYQQNAMGNIRERHIQEIWKSERYKFFRRALKLGKRGEFSACKDCNNRMVIT